MRERTAPITRGCRTKVLLSDVFKTIPGMAHNFIACDREQSFLLPPDVRDWLPEDHLAWFVIDAVGVMELYATASRERRSRERHHPRPNHHIDFLAASDEFRKWAESLCICP